MAAVGRKELILAGVLSLLAGGALYNALQSHTGLDQDIVMMNVNTLRNSILGFEDGLGRAPMACGSVRRANLALQVEPELLGPCGSTYLGRDPNEGPYWVTVSPGGLDFQVTGLLLEGDEVVTVRATRRDAAHLVE